MTHGFLTQMFTTTHSYVLGPKLGRGDTRYDLHLLREDHSTEADFPLVIKRERVGAGAATSISSIQTEIDTLRSIRHRNIVPLLDFGVDSQSGRDRRFFVMPRADHDDLKSYVPKLQTLESRDRFGLSLGLLRNLLSAFVQLHSRAMLHNDTKASNVLVFRDKTLEADYRVYFVLSDFDIACPEGDPTIPNTEAPSFNTDYGPPWGAIDRSRAADLYRLGCLVLMFATMEKGGDWMLAKHDDYVSRLSEMADNGLRRLLSTMIVLEKESVPTASKLLREAGKIGFFGRHRRPASFADSWLAIGPAPSPPVGPMFRRLARGESGWHKQHLAWSPDGHWLAISQASGGAIIVDANRWQTAAHLQPPSDHSDAATSVHWARRGDKYSLYGLVGSTGVVWDWNQSDAIVPGWTFTNAGVFSVSLAPVVENGSQMHIAIWEERGLLRTRQDKPGEEQNRYFTSGVTGLSVLQRESPELGLVAVAHVSDATAEVWRVSSWSAKSGLTYANSKHPKTVAYSNSAKCVDYAVSDASRIIVFLRNEGKEIRWAKVDIPASFVVTIDTNPERLREVFAIRGDEFALLYHDGSLWKIRIDPQNQSLADIVRIAAENSVQAVAAHPIETSLAVITKDSRLIRIPVDSSKRL